MEIGDQGYKVWLHQHFEVCDVLLGNESSNPRMADLCPAGDCVYLGEGGFSVQKHLCLPNQVSVGLSAVAGEEGQKSSFSQYTCSIG